MAVYTLVRSSWFWFWLSLTALCFSIGGSILDDIIFAKSPYRNVDVIIADVSEDEFHLVANFEKTDCEFVNLTVVGIGFLGTSILKWVDNDNLGPARDRTVGTHTLRITAFLGNREYDRIEVRTRHLCGSEKVDRVFMEYDLETYF